MPYSPATGASAFLKMSPEERTQFSKRLIPERRAKLFNECFAEIWLGNESLPEDEIEMFFDPQSSLVQNAPADFARAMLETATTHEEIIGWQRDAIYNRIDQFLDTYFGLDFVGIEGQIAGPTASRFGAAAWSEANLESGWLTNYADFYFLVEDLQLKPGSHLVDIGSGHGRTGFLIGLLYTEFIYTGFEIVRERAEAAAALGRPYEHLTFACQDVSELTDKTFPRAEIYYVYDALNTETARGLLDQLATGCAGSRLVVRDGKGIALGLLKSDRRFKKQKSFIGDERLYQPVTIFEIRGA